MPIYTYRCANCGRETESLVLPRAAADGYDPAKRPCGACGELALEKQVSAAGFRFKGEGQYGRGKV